MEQAGSYAIVVTVIVSLRPVVAPVYKGFGA